MPAPRNHPEALLQSANRGMHPRSHGLVCTLRGTHYPSLASAGVAEDSGRFWQIVSESRAKQYYECEGPREFPRPFFFSEEGMTGSERLCAWYLRLNGYLTTANFYLHDRHETLGEVDVIGVRFPHSRELDFIDDPVLDIQLDKTDVVLATTKRGMIGGSLDKFLTAEPRETVEYVLLRIGAFEERKVKDVSAKLYEPGSRSLVQDGFRVRVLSFAESIDGELAKNGVAFVSWAHVLEFIRDRFLKNEKLKAQHDRWEPFGQYLWEWLIESDSMDPATFFSEWERRAGRMKKAYEGNS